MNLPKLSFLLIFFILLNSYAEFIEVWKKPIPETGLSGVCVQNGLIFLTVNDIEKPSGETKGFITATNIKGKCYDLEGNLKWEVKLKGSKGTKMIDCWLDGTAVAPSANDKYVWFLNILGELVCCTHDGKEVWRKSFSSNGGITPSKLILYKDKLIVSLPTGEKAGKYNLHRLQALKPESGEVIWKSEKILNHACRYDLVESEGEKILLASVSELSHYKIGEGFQVYAISPETGKCIKQAKTEQFMQHFRCIQHNNKFITITKKGSLNFTDFSSGKIDSSATKACKVYYQWNGKEYVEKGEDDLKSEVKHGKVNLPTKSSMNLFGDKLFYFSGGTNAIFCFDLKSQKRTWLEVPYQIINSNKIWNYSDIVYTDGVKDSSGKIVMNSKKSHGYVGYGWGHVNISEPIQVENKLYWLGGVGTIYIIDLTKDFGPEALGTVTIDDVGEAWTFGKMAYSDSHLYIRSQKDLFKVKIK